MTDADLKERLERHSWKHLTARIASLEAENAKLTDGMVALVTLHDAKVASLEVHLAEARKLVRGAYSEGFSEGMREHTTSRGGKTWQESATYAALHPTTGDQS